MTIPVPHLGGGEARGKLGSLCVFAWERSDAKACVMGYYTSYLGVLLGLWLITKSIELIYGESYLRSVYWRSLCRTPKVLSLSMENLICPGSDVRVRKIVQFPPITWVSHIFV